MVNCLRTSCCCCCTWVMLEAVDDVVEELVFVVVFVPGLCLKLLMTLFMKWLLFLFLYLGYV